MNTAVLYFAKTSSPSNLFLSPRLLERDTLRSRDLAPEYSAEEEVVRWALLEPCLCAHDAPNKRVETRIKLLIIRFFIFNNIFGKNVDKESLIILLAIFAHGVSVEGAVAATGDQNFAVFTKFNVSVVDPKPHQG